MREKIKLFFASPKTRSRASAAYDGAVLAITLHYLANIYGEKNGMDITIDNMVIFAAVVFLLLVAWGLFGDGYGDDDE